MLPEVQYRISVPGTNERQRGWLVVGKRPNVYSRIVRGVLYPGTDVNGIQKKEKETRRLWDEKRKAPANR